MVSSLAFHLSLLIYHTTGFQAYTHMYLDRTDSLTYSLRWLPKPEDPKAYCQTGTRRYVEARLHML